MAGSYSFLFRVPAHAGCARGWVRCALSTACCRGRRLVGQVGGGTASAASATWSSLEVVLVAMLVLVPKFFPRRNVLLWRRDVRYGRCSAFQHRKVQASSPGSCQRGCARQLGHGRVGGVEQTGSQLSARAARMCVPAHSQDTRRHTQAPEVNSARGAPVHSNTYPPNAHRKNCTTGLVSGSTFSRWWTRACLHTRQAGHRVGDTKPCTSKKKKIPPTPGPLHTHSHSRQSPSPGPGVGSAGCRPRARASPARHH